MELSEKIRALRAETGLNRKQFAEHFQMYLQLMGYNAVVVKDVKWMEQTKNLVTSADTVFVLSVRNTTPELAQSLRVARHIGARTLLIITETIINYLSTDAEAL